MSIPVNPLSKYRSYNYQQMLLVCDTTETAEELSASNEFLDFIRSKDADRMNSSVDPYAKYRPYEIGLNQGRKGRYVILIDGTQDAEFIINKAHWYNTVAAGAGDIGTEFSTYNAGGELEIQEPQGIRFMNVLSKIADDLGSDPTGLIFMLKTVFIGHATATYTDDGFPDPITNIRPFLFWMSNLTGSFTITGGNYKVEFAGLNNGASKNPHILHGASRIKIDTGAGSGECEANTLAGALCKLQAEIARVYDIYYNKIKDQVEKAVGTEGTFRGRKVKYAIKVVSPLDGPDYLVTDFRDAATNTAETGKGGIIELSNEPSVEAAILAIAKRCPKLQEDLVVGDSSEGRQYRYVPKVATTIESTDTEYKIVYTLRRVLEVRDDLIQILSERTSDNVLDQDGRVLNNLLELDYMYTGHNTDVLDFDLNMEMGLALYQNLATTENLPTAGQSANGGEIPTELANKQPKNVKNTFTGRIRPGTPIFLSTIVKDEAIKHATNPKRAVSYQEELNRHAALENIESVVKIHGNPGLLDAVNLPPSQISAATPIEDQPTYGLNVVGTPVFPYWESLPAIVKINIKMPSVYYGGAQSTNDYSEPFWYDGYFYCYAIEQMFDAGEFTQQLHLISIPKNSPDSNTQASVSQTEQTEQTIQANQNSKLKGSGTASGSATSTTTNTTPAIDPNSLTVDQQLKANAG